MPIITDLYKPKQREWLLRWRMDFAGRPTKIGHWGRSEVQLSGMAAMQMREGLVRAAVEAKNIITRETMILAECDGWDFNLFKWMANAHAPCFIKGSITPYTRCVGLMLVTREFEIEVYDTGDIIKVARTEEDKNFHYATFGR